MHTGSPIKERVTDFILIGVVAAGILVPAILIGPPIGPEDIFHHLRLAGAYVESFQSGVLVPSWTGVENNGYGSVTVRVYPPLAHYLIAACKLIFGSWHLATFAAFAIWSFVGSLGVYLWAKETFADRIGALAAAFLFALAPYHLNQYYNSFMWAEFAALSILPFAFLFVRRVVRNGGIGSVLGLGIAYALLVLGNIPQAVIGSLGLGVYAICLLDRETVRNVWKLCVAGLLGLTLSAFYWVRTFMEIDRLTISLPNTNPHYDFRNHFLLGSFSFDDRFVWFASILLVLALAAALVALAASGSFTKLFRDRDPRAIAIFGLVSVILMVPLSRPLWELLTPLQRVQFPWRFLSLTGLAAAMLAGYAIAEIRAMKPASARPRTIILVGIIAVTATFSVKQVILAAVYSDPVSYDRSADAAEHKIGLEHWLPTWVTPATFKPTELIQSRSRSITGLTWNDADRQFTIESGEPERIRFGLMYYPGWQATVNGRPAEILQMNGAAGLDIGTERSEVDLQFVEPVYTPISGSISLISWLLAAAALIYSFTRNRIRKTKIA